MMIASKDISFIIQGELKSDIYTQSTKAIREIFPEAEIVLASYIGTDTTGLDYDQCTLVEDPGFYYYGNALKSKTNNINRQIQTTLNGLKIAKGKYAFKVRSDFIINGIDFIRYFNDFPESDPEYKVFEKKILASVFFSRDPRKNEFPLPYHPSDIAFFGLRTDLLKLFDIPLMPKNEAHYFEFNGISSCRYVPEQYLWITCLRNNGKDIKCDYQWDCNDQIAEDTERYIVSNFIYLEYEQFNLIPTKKLRLFSENDFNSLITHIEWQKLYKKYVNHLHEVPELDIQRNELDQKLKLVKKRIKLAKYLAALIPLSLLRRHLRLKLTKYFIKKYQI